MKKIAFLLCLTALIFANCKNEYSGENAATAGSSHNYPPEIGFNLDSSDAEAMALADEVMAAMGGYDNWKNTHYLSWNFFGRRKSLWNKWTGDVRIEVPESETIILVNVNDSTGKVSQGGKILLPSDTLCEQLLRKGITWWINDSYWLVMPFKLKDSGVTLRYLGERMTQDSTLADCMQLTFENVGLSPEHKYQVYVDKTTKLVCQWDYFDNFKNETPAFSTPWKDYQEYGKVLLSSSRGQNALSEIQVLETVDEKRFEAF